MAERLVMAPIFRRAQPTGAATQKNGEILSRDYAASAIFLLAVTFVTFGALSRTEGCLAMARKFTFRQLVVLIFALWYDLSRGQIGSRTGFTENRVSQLLTRMRRKEIDDEDYEKLLSAVVRRRAMVPLTRAFVEAFDGLDRESALTEDEQAAISKDPCAGLSDGSRRPSPSSTKPALSPASRSES